MASLRGNEELLPNILVILITQEELTKIKFFSFSEENKGAVFR